MIDERRAWLEQLTNQGREIGRLEMQVRQLEAPRPNLSRHDTTDVVEIVASPIEEGSGANSSTVGDATCRRTAQARHLAENVWLAISPTCTGATHAE